MSLPSISKTLEKLGYIKDKDFMIVVNQVVKLQIQLNVGIKAANTRLFKDIWNETIHLVLPLPVWKGTEKVSGNRKINLYKNVTMNNN